MTLISQICGVIAAGLIAAGVLMVCEMVFVRYVLNQNTIWQTDFITYCLVGATFIGSPYVLLTRGHVNVDVLPHYLGRTARYYLALASILMSMAFCAVMTVLTFNFWHEAWDQGWVSDTHVAGAAVDSLRHDADRARPASRCNTSSISSVS